MQISLRSLLQSLYRLQGGSVECKTTEGRNGERNAFREAVRKGEKGSERKREMWKIGKKWGRE